MRLPLVTLFAFFLATGVLAQEIDQKELCLGCHDVTVDTAVAHPPARDGDCTACHNPHASRFDKLLQERPGPLCLSCHTEMIEVLDQASVHPPAVEGRCAGCHSVHGGDHEKLLWGPREKICAGCHGDVARWQTHTVKHRPFERGKCFICHEAHAAPFPGMSKREVRQTCLMCHRDEEKLAVAHQGYPVNVAPNVNCRFCHEPHASELKGLFRQQLHPLFEQGKCADCHKDPDSAAPFELHATLAELCHDCHPDVVNAALNASFPHVSDGGEGCTDCHNPHTGWRPLLPKKEPDFCLDCHDPGGSSSGEAGRFRSHGKDGAMRCTECHAAIHGSERPLMLKEDPIDLCSRCHAHQHTITHPMGEGARDPRGGRPMDCLSCHGMHDAAYPDYMHKDGSRDLCLSCHKELDR